MGGGFGVVEEFVLPSPALIDNNESYAKAAEMRAGVDQCKRTQEDLKAMFRAEREGKAKLKLLPEIFLCQQHFKNKTHVHQSFFHELVHAVDLCR